MSSHLDRTVLLSFVDQIIAEHLKVRTNPDCACPICLLNDELSNSFRHCTGVAARRCPIHGECTDAGHDAVDPYSTHCSDVDCPLHGLKSLHAELTGEASTVVTE